MKACTATRSLLKEKSLYKDCTITFFPFKRLGGENSFKRKSTNTLFTTTKKQHTDWVTTEIAQTHKNTNAQKKNRKTRNVYSAQTHKFPPNFTKLFQNRHG